jgi:hypothetical protein
VSRDDQTAEGVCVDTDPLTGGLVKYATANDLRRPMGEARDVSRAATLDEARIDSNDKEVLRRA